MAAAEAVGEREPAGAARGDEAGGWSHRASEHSREDVQRVRDSRPQDKVQYATSQQIKSDQINKFGVDLLPVGDWSSRCAQALLQPGGEWAPTLAPQHEPRPGGPRDRALAVAGAAAPHARHGAARVDYCCGLDGRRRHDLVAVRDCYLNS